MQHDSLNWEWRSPQLNLDLSRHSGSGSGADANLGDGSESRGAAVARQPGAERYEGRRVAWELHDQLAPKLATLEIELAGLEYASAADAATRARLQALRARVIQISNDIHRICYQLHPTIVEDLGLTAALAGYCEEFSSRSAVKTKFTSVDVPEDLPHRVALCLYRVVQEALQNVARHSGSKHAIVGLRGLGDGVQVAVRDYGCGFDPGTAHERGGRGLTAIRERARLAGGTCSIRSSPGRGTRILVSVPWSGPFYAQQASA